MVLLRSAGEPNWRRLSNATSSVQLYGIAEPWTSKVHESRAASEVKSMLYEIQEPCENEVDGRNQETLNARRCFL